MSPDRQSVPLAELTLIPYVDTSGRLPQQFAGKIGAYAIFAADQTLQYVGYSRDIYVSLRQHLVRQPQQCHGLKVQLIERPSRTLLETICQDWLKEPDVPPPGNTSAQTLWEEPLSIQAAMTDAEQASFDNPHLDDLGRIKVLKQVGRRLEAEILAVLAARGVQETIRFNPKLKEKGVLEVN
ncbi:GIY-YIG nuclease family protein [Synechococcales cyanobacterium C]|uniref:GIY-YIG nuclease family protein n=1 Tax=Petrachloros mirabilis ULC683 TaxID=2781853 RepID=A0A8K2A281_9CYAN|nr:GIY-YIG nuclease family protein [Petrachloros mirabilis]NCJ08521.1 GIY-YIG nuclease family protein [Petrachloros mirabilis ULC683]